MEIRNMLPFNITYSFIQPLKNLKKKKLYKRLLKGLESSSDEEYRKYASIMRKTGHLSPFNGEFEKKYDPRDVRVRYDRKNKAYYVNRQIGEDYRRCYFLNKYMAHTAYNALLKEQDYMSPHRYFSDLVDNVMKGQGGTILDLGAAEGFFSLEYIDRVDKAILFEPWEVWNPFLKLTFSRFRKKVRIENSFVGEKTDRKNNIVSIDEYFGDEMPEDIKLIKMDIEGFEQETLRGMKKVLEKNPQAVLLVCSYHKRNAEKEIREILEPMGYNVAAREGRILYYFDMDLDHPDLRHGVLEAVRE